MSRRSFLSAVAPATAMAGLVLCATVPAHADDGVIADYFAHWFDRVDAAQASQPKWITPLATVTPRLEEEFRFDASTQTLGNGAHLDNYGGGKGLELIPTETTEVIVNVPPYEVRSNVKAAQGWGDDTVLLIKQRLLSATQDQGDYIVSAFLGFQAPTGATAFTNDAWVVTPTLAAGKGFGPFDIQATVGVGLPTAHQNLIGRAVATNATLQYHVLDYFWPEIEVNDTWWSGGERDGKNQVVLTPGVVVGRFPLGGRAKAVFGMGYQIAVSPELARTPALTPTFDHGLLFTARVGF